jgi:hypothetical protein
MCRAAKSAELAESEDSAWRIGTACALIAQGLYLAELIDGETFERGSDIGGRWTPAGRYSRAAQ